MMNFSVYRGGVVQVGIKYGGKGDVDITGLEIELREPYKVSAIGNYADCRSRAGRVWGRGRDASCISRASHTAAAIACT